MFRFTESKPTVQTEPRTPGVPPVRYRGYAMTDAHCPKLGILYANVPLT